jgi:glycerol-1-phosphate dehydrogenase [NAD(P)+]
MHKMDVWPLPRISYRELSSVKESRPTALITQAAAWAAVSKTVQLPLIIQAEPNRNDKDFFEYLAANSPSPVQVIYAVGDGLAVDAAKVVASHNQKPLVIIPTAISSDKPFTPSSTVRENNLPKEVATGPADEVVIDMNLIRQAPPHLRAAGIVDVLSIVTALRDWAYADQKKQNTPETAMIPWATSIGAGLAAQAIKSAAAIGKGEPDALRMLINLLAMTVQLDNLLGHQRLSHGIEHLFAEVVKADNSVSHAERVGPGILIASALYGKDSASLRAPLEAAGVRLNQLKPEDIQAALNALPDYAQHQKAPYSILYEIHPNAPEITQALSRSTLVGSQ